MKLNFRKIASVIASAVMIGSTAGAAFAANYPAPLVVGGTADAAVVVTSGTHAGAISDWDAAVSLKAALDALVTTSTSTTGATATGGDSINLATSARKLYYGDAINAGRTSITATELPNVLKDGKFVDLAGTEYGYTQTVQMGPALVTFGTSGGDLDDPMLYVDGGNNGALTEGWMYNYTLSLNKNLNVSDATNVQGQKINILGVDYVIGSSSTSTVLYLYGSGETLTVSGGESQTVTIAGTDHTVELVTTSSATAGTIKVDGVSKSVTEGYNYGFAGDINVYVKDVIHPAYAGDLRQAELIVGANTLKLQNGQSVKVGADLTSVKGTVVRITGTSPDLISKVVVETGMQKTKTDSLVAGESFVDPVFGGMQVQFAGVVPMLDSTARGNVVVNTDNNQFAYVTFTSARAGTAGEQKLTYVYDNTTSASTVQPLLAHQTISSNAKGVIHVLEGETAREGDQIVVNQGDAGTILTVDEISVDVADLTGTVNFVDAITGESQEVTVTNATVNTYTKTGVNMFGGNGYNVTVNGSLVTVVWSTSGTKTLFPRIKLADGGWLAFLTETNVSDGNLVILPDGLTTISTSGSNISGQYYPTRLLNGINWTTTGNSTVTTVEGISNPACNFSLAKGPAILFIEPKKWDDASYGNFICVPMSTAGTTEIAITTPALNGTNSGAQTLTSDVYESQYLDVFGALVKNEQRTNENGQVTISYPASQMFADVLFTAEGATVTPGSAGGVGGSVMFVKDTEVDTVKDKNLVVVGGSCVNTVARMIVDPTATAPICGEDFTAKTNVDAGKYLVQAVASPYNSAKTAVLVAGFEAAETKLAVAKLKEGADTTVGATNVFPQTTA